MIDWLTLVVPALHRAQNAGKVISYRQDGAIEWEADKRMTLEGSYSSTIQVRTLDSYQGIGTKLWISGNPTKFYQGHNLFGTDDLPHLARVFVLDVISRLGIELRPEDRALIDAGVIQVTRVDSTGSYALPSREDVRAWIRAAQVVAYGKHQKTSAYDAQTLYIGQKSKRTTLKIYCKGDELEVHPLPKDMPHYEYEDLLKFADNLLRVEATYRSKWLKERGLEWVSAWGYNTASDLLREKVQAVNLPENLPISNTASEEIEGLPSRLRAVYKLWLQGEDLRSMYPKPTYYRYRSQLLKHGIDLNCPPREKPEESNIVPMWRYLVAEPVGIPEWAIGTSLYFDPSKPNLKVL